MISMDLFSAFEFSKSSLIPAPTPSHPLTLRALEGMWSSEHVPRNVSIGVQKFRLPSSSDE